MPPKTNSISGDEMTLRLHAPKFFQELIDSRTASLIEANDPEALTAWKQEREQKDQLWKEILKDNPQVQQQVLDREVLEQSVKGFALEFSRRVPEINEEVLQESLTDIIRNEQDPPWDHNAPPLDMRHTVAKELDNKKEQELNDRNLSAHSMPGAGREEFLKEQLSVGKEVEAVKNEQAIPPKKIDPPSND